MPVCKVQLLTQGIDSALCSLPQVHDVGGLHEDIHLSKIVINEDASDMTAAPAICCECALRRSVCQLSSRPREHATDIPTEITGVWVLGVRAAHELFIS